MEKKTCILSLLIVMIILLSCNAEAQSSGKITGKVTDAQTGEPLIGVTIVVEGTHYGTITDNGGEYIIVKVPSGVYSVAATYLGYNRTVTKNVQVLTDLTSKINFQLGQTSVTLNQEVVVTAQAPLVRKDMTSTEARVTADEIQKLPLQDLSQLITMQAGVNKDVNGNLHIRGGRSSEISYLLNGVSITDDYSRSQALTIETGSVQELQVISGTFNAEYGNAMSGVVNVVTRTGSSKFQSSLELWTGDYISSHKDIFWNINKVSPAANYNFQATFGGPVLGDNLTYFFTARRFYNSGYIYGINRYSPQGRARFDAGRMIPNPGDNSYVAMNSNDRWSGQGTIDWQMAKPLKLKIDAFASTESGRYYNHLYRLNPYGDKGGTSLGYSFFAKLIHQLFTNTFHEITAAYKYNDYTSRLYDDPYDPRYVHPDSLNVAGYHFLTAGTNLNRFQRNTKSMIFKWDLTSQIDKLNLAKIGVEVQTDKLFYENINIIPAVGSNGQQVFPFQPFIQGIESPQHDRFERTPFKFSAYAQDKIEFESLIINLGIRFDLFDPQGKIPVDPEDPNVYNPFKLEHTFKDLNGDSKIGLDEQTDA
ncbi:MAG: TonB-dependent receptor, partial [Syntrophothermus sp.]